MKQTIKTAGFLITKISRGHLLTYFAAIFVSVPIFFVFRRMNISGSEIWDHFKTFLLPDALKNTFVILSLTLLVSSVIGVFAATAVEFFDFPLRRLFKWLMYLPLIMPPYISAYVYSGMLGYTGFIQKSLRGFGINYDPAAFDIMNSAGAVYIYSLAFFPYVYATVRSFLENHSADMIEASRLLGCGPFKIFIKVILPLVRIPLSAGLSLVAMEVLSEYGVVSYFNIRTITTSIFGSWFGFGDTLIAIRLSFYVLLFILLMQSIDAFFRGKKRYTLGSGRSHPISPVKIKRVSAAVIFLLLSLIFLTAFLVILLQLIFWSISAFDKLDFISTILMIRNSLFVNLSAVFLILLISILIAHDQRWLKRTGKLVIGKLTQLGYSIPGAVTAIGVISFFVFIDERLYPFYSLIDPDTKKLVLSTSVVMLIFALVIRYLAVGFNTVASGFSKIGTKFSDAAAVLGKSKIKGLFLVELPLLKSTLLSAAILSFVDIARELPLTLMLRPFNFNTLASRVYEYANDERIHEASIPALILIFLSLIGIIIFSFIKTSRRKRT